MVSDVNLHHYTAAAAAARAAADARAAEAAVAPPPLPPPFVPPPKDTDPPIINMRQPGVLAETSSGQLVLETTWLQGKPYEDPG